MPRFVLNTPIETREATIKVEVDPAQPLRPGKYVFRLVVVDNDDLRSAPADVDVFVVDDQRPTAILKAPSRVLVGRSFELDGRASVDPTPGGEVVRYIWELVSAEPIG